MSKVGKALGVGSSDTGGNVGFGKIPGLDFRKFNRLGEDIGGPDAVRAARERQESAINFLQARAEGRSTSLAEQQLRTGQDRAARAAASRAAGARGTSQALLARQAAQEAAAAEREANQQAATLRAGEQQAAEQGLVDVRTQNLGEVGNLARQFDMAQRQQAALDQQRFIAQAQGQAGAEQSNASRSFQAGQADLGRLGNTIGSAASAAAMFSDETTKENIKDAKDSDLSEFAKAITAKTFKYKDEAHGDTKEESVGFLAQDIEKSKLGKKLVQDIDGKKAIDMRKGLMASLALQGATERRMSNIEEALKARSESNKQNNTEEKES